jgi:nitroreductase
MTSNRKADFPIHPQFTDRWSPRAFDARPIAKDDLMRLFEAARWAPSGSNLQPWRFIYALKATAEFDVLMQTLVPFNQGWAKNASGLIFIAGVKSFDGEREVSHSDFDSGAAWMSLALQAHSQGLITHGMAGLDYEAAHKTLGLNDRLKLICAIAVGYKAEASILDEPYRSREAPSGRQELSAMVFEGRYDGTNPVNPSA